MARVFVAVLLLGQTACWRLEPTTLGDGPVGFAPASGAPEDWVVSFLTLPVECPDGEDALMYVVHPAEPVASMPVAVVYHSGSFDFVFGASPNDPIAGPGFQPTSRLTSRWAAHRVFALLGMYPSDDPLEATDGSLIAALAERGVASVLPANCWGDLWHNYPGIADNDYEKDLFFRQGRVAAEWSFGLAAEPDVYAPVLGFALPFEPDTSQVITIGIGEGGRAVGELLHAGKSPAAFAVDSSPDDLTWWWSLPAGSEQVVGLERIFPGGPTAVGSLADAPALPARSVFWWSSLDAALPAEATQRIRDRLASEPEAWVYDSGLPQHTQLPSDLALSREVVDWLLSSGPG